MCIINLLASGRFDSNLECVILLFMLRIELLSTSCAIDPMRKKLATVTAHSDLTVSSW